MGSAGGQQTTQTQFLGQDAQRFNDIRYYTAQQAQQNAPGNMFTRTPQELWEPTGAERQYLGNIQQRAGQPLTNTVEGQALAGMERTLGQTQQGMASANQTAQQQAAAAGARQEQLYGFGQQYYLNPTAEALWQSQGMQQGALGQAQQNISDLTWGAQQQLGQYDANQGYNQALGGLDYGRAMQAGIGQGGWNMNQWAQGQLGAGGQQLDAQTQQALQSAWAQQQYASQLAANAQNYGQAGTQAVAGNLGGLQQMGGQWGSEIGQYARNAAAGNVLDEQAMQQAGLAAGPGQQGWLNEQLGAYGGWGGSRLAELSGQLGGNLQQNSPEAQAWQYLNQAGGAGRTGDILGQLGGLQQWAGDYGTGIAQRAQQAGQWGALDTAGFGNLAQATGGGLTGGILDQMAGQRQGYTDWGSALGQAATGAAGTNAADLAGGNFLNQATGAGYTPQIFEQLRMQQERMARAEAEGTGIGAGLQQGMGQNQFETAGLGGLQQAGQAGYTPEIMAQIQAQRQQQLAQQAGIAQGIQGGMGQNQFEGLGVGGLQQAMQQGLTPDILARIQQQQAQAQQQGAGISQGMQQGMQQNQYEALGMQGLQGAMGAGMTPQIQQALQALSQRGDAGSIAIRDRLLQSLGPNAMEAYGNQAFQGAAGDLGTSQINQNLAQQLQQGGQAGQQIGQQVQAGQALTPQEQQARAQLEQSYADQGMTGINQQLAQMNQQGAANAQQIRDRLTQNMGLTGFEQWGQEQFNRATDPTQQLGAARQYLEQVVGGELANRLQQGGLGGVRSGAYGEDLSRAGADLILPILQQTQQIQGQAGQAGLQAGAGLRQAGIQTGGIEQGLLGQLQQGGLGAAQVGAGMLGDVRGAQTAAGQAGLQAEAQRRAAGVQGAGLQGDILGQLLQTGLGGAQVGAQMSAAQRQAMTQQGQAQLQAGAAQRGAGVQAGGIEANMLQALQQSGLGGQQLLGALEQARQQTQLGVGQAGLGAGEAYRQAGLTGAGIERDLLGQQIQQGQAGTQAMTDLERQRQQTALGVGQAGLGAGEAYRQAGLTGAQIQAGMMGQVGQTGAQGTATAADLERARQATQLGIGQAGLQAGGNLRQAGIAGAGVQADLLQTLLQGSGQGANTLLDLERARQATALGAGQAQFQQAQGLRQAGLEATGQQGNILSQLIGQGTAQTGQMGELERARQATALGAGQAQYQQAQGLRQAGLGAAGIETDLLTQLQQGGIQGQQLAAQMDQSQRQAQLGVGQAGLQQGQAMRQAGIDTGGLNAQMMQNYLNYGLGSTGLSAEMANQQRQGQLGAAQLAGQLGQNQRAGGLQAAGLQGDMLNQLLGTGTQGQQILGGMYGQNQQAGIAAAGQQGDMLQSLLSGGLGAAGQRADYTQTMIQNLLNQNTANLGQQAQLAGQVMGTGADIYGTRAQAGAAGLGAMADIYGTGVGAQTALSGQALGAQSNWQQALNQYAGMGLENQANYMNQLGGQQGRYLDYGLGQGQQALGYGGLANQTYAQQLGYGTGLEDRDVQRQQQALQAAGQWYREPAYDAWSRDADTILSILTGVPTSASSRIRGNTQNERDWVQFGMDSVGTIAQAAGMAFT